MSSHNARPPQSPTSNHQPEPTPQPRSQPRRQPQPTPRPSFFQIPAPIRTLFNAFPLHEYPPPRKPLRASRARTAHTLYIFTTAADAARARPSLNPSCCRWQTYLHLCGVAFNVAPATNHASPSGALPFLIPAASEAAVTAAELREWAHRCGNKGVAEGKELAAYHALVTGPLRTAYLAALYLDSGTYEAFTAPYYTHGTTSTLVRWALSVPLRAAALDEVLSPANIEGQAGFDEDAVLADAREALEALSTLLAKRVWFEGEAGGMLDALVFGYTHCLLSMDEQGRARGRAGRRLCAMVGHERVGNLRKHRDMVLRTCYGGVGE